MQFDLLAAALLGNNALIDHLELFDAPAVLFDRDLKLIYKNRESRGQTGYLRFGMKLKRFISEESVPVISEMVPGQIHHTEFCNGDHRSAATVVCCRESNLMMFKQAGAGISRIVEDFCGKMSGYDISVTAPVPESENISLSSGIRSKTVAELILKLLDEYKTAYDMPFFNSASVLHGIISATEEFDTAFRGRITMEGVPDEHITRGSERDFALVIAYTLAYCIDIGTKNRVSVEMRDAADDVVFHIETQTDLSETELAVLTSCKTSESLNEGCGYWFYLIKLLSEFNLWTFDTGFRRGGTVLFDLRVPTVRSLGDFVLRDISPEFLRNIISLVFGKART